MSKMNLENESDNESEIAAMAARVLQERFIAAAQAGPVLYVENDYLVRKIPNELPVVIKHLEGRNPDIAQRFVDHRTFKINRK
ncbi:hypothetical protein ACKVE0_13295 [Acinetobacter albensis]|uniref:Uncharacterized protein n=1 Tax=Acinetobacter albensis TaxID=1673609 RepID=A0ABW9JVG5_9GAMM|nr:hypothetical protein [Acinetobacter lwoffii]MCO8098335.1 hypothetical protein [Acinetobacter lwoffii]